MWYNGKVIKTEDASSVTRRFWIEVQPGGENEAAEKFNFQAGQFVVMDLPIHEKRLNRWRSYSIANEPDGTGILEFCIVRMENGMATKYLFDEVIPGTIIRFKGPEGTFFLKDPIEKDLVMVSTGTGVAPFRSMIRDIIRLDKPHRKIHLIYGTRQAENILYHEEFKSLQTKLPGFQYDIVLSREKEWEGKKGHVHQVYMEQYREKRPDICFYLCGWSQMIDEAVANLLLELKFDRTQIIYELYG